MKIKPTEKPGRVLVEMGKKDEELLARTVPVVFQLKEILVPIDFSECSKKAILYAIPFARQFNASITLMHVLNVNFGGGEFGVLDVSMIENQMRESAHQQLEALLKDLPGDLNKTTLLRSGRPAYEIVEAAKRLDTDLIIISTHGHTGLKHVFLGSTAENVVRYAPCPVLTVREHEHEFVKS
jgi:universal stress protein A